MATFIGAFGLFFVTVLAMASGVLLTGRRLRGSCGGVGSASCRCGPEKQARCKSTGAKVHADQPIAPASLTRVIRGGGSGGS